MLVLESQGPGKLCWACCGVSYSIPAASVAEMEPGIPEGRNVKDRFQENHPEHVRPSLEGCDVLSGNTGCNRRDGATAVKHVS